MAARPFRPDVVHAEHPKKGLPLLLIGAGVGGTLLAIGLIVVIAMQAAGAKKPDQNRTVGSNKPDQNRTATPPAEDRQTEVRLADERRQVEEQQKQGQKFDDAKKLLTGNLASAGGTAETNVKKGIELLNQHLSRPNASSQAGPRRLLEQAQFTLSDEKAMTFLLSLDDYDRRKFADEAETIVIVKKSALERLSPGFSDVYNTKIEKEGEETSVFIKGGEYQSSMANAFFDRLKKNAKRAIEQVAKERQKQEEKRQAAREENPKLTSLIFSIEDKPEAFAGRCMYFDEFGMYGKTDKQSDADYRLGVTDSRGKHYNSVGFQEKEIVFSTSRKIATQIHALTQEDNEYKVKLYCDMYVSTRGDPWAVVYKIEFYNRGGGIAFTIKD